LPAFAVAFGFDEDATEDAGVWAISDEVEVEVEAAGGRGRFGRGGRGRVGGPDAILAGVGEAVFADLGALLADGGGGRGGREGCRGM
jgi:hypothetical protein